MKKILLTFMAAVGLAASANAQLALQNFDGPTYPAPAGWVMVSDGHTVSASFVSGLPWVADSLDLHAWMPINGSYTGYGTGNYQMLTTSYFSPAATADRWLMTPAFNVTSTNMVITWDDDDLSSGENLELWVSPTAGTTTASYTTMLYSAAASSGGLGAPTHQVSLAAYNGTSIRVGFREHTNDGWGLIIDNVQTAILPSLDLGVTSLNIYPFVQTGSSNTISGVLHNYGVTTVNSLNINYSVNGGAPVTSPVSSLTMALGDDYTFSSATPWVPATAGSYTIKVWGDNINGSGVDEDHTNDTFTANVLVIDTLQPKTVMIEEFTQASCDPCANAHVNVDTVYANNLSRAVMLRYHVNFPGRDCMDTVTLSPFVSARLSYYSVSGVPDAQVDGSYVYPGAAGPGTFSTSVIGSAAAPGSPFKITITPAFNASTHTYSFSADIKAYGDMPSGLRAFACLVVDTLTYAANQSTESIPQYIFPQVAEAMLPNSSGTALTAFTAGSTQTITASWVKNHPWASNRSVWAYDSTLTGKIIVWVQNNTTKYVYQAAAADVSTGTTSVETVIGGNGNLDVYPNPASGTATVAVNLKAAAEVKMEVYNMAGQVVYSTPVESRNVGSSISGINLASFAAGDYLVKVTIGTEVLTKKLTVAK